jgi:endonuclease YncB( thermonuclease family)
MAPVVALESVTIHSCYDGDTCRTTTGERIRLVCIDTPELRGKLARG